jgi:hypothetical protein
LKTQEKGSWIGNIRFEQDRLHFALAKEGNKKRRVARGAVVLQNG